MTIDLGRIMPAKGNLALRSWIPVSFAGEKTTMKTLTYKTQTYLRIDSN